MNISTIALLLHIGTLIGDVKDVEKLVKDILAKQPIGDDLKQVLSDLAALFANGLAPMPPGMTASEVAAVFTSLLAAV